MRVTRPLQDAGYLIKIHAPAKINLHLEVLGLRPDGFHELAMVMQSIDLSDHLHMNMQCDGLIRLTSDCPSLSTDEDNLIVKAAKLLRSRCGKSSLGALIHLQKKIPIGAGLAGGSSDAAATLLGLNELWGLSLSKRELMELALELGSDVPFCLVGGSQLCFGRGEKLEPLKASTPSMAILLVKDPLINISTPWAYQRCKAINGGNYLQSESEFEESRKSLREKTWLNPLEYLEPPPLINDLQKVVAPEVPVVSNSLKYLSELPETLGFAMSGSGPSCFALYSNYQNAKDAWTKNRMKFESLGLEIWCCSFQSKGVYLDP